MFSSRRLRLLCSLKICLRVKYRNVTNFKSLTYKTFGDPIQVLKLSENCLEDPKGKQVLVKILAAPINPADVNIIQGKYPVKPKLPATAGNECVAEVVCAGDKAQGVKPGDRVVFLKSNMGSWSTHALVNEDQIFVIPKELGLAQAATLTVNPSTAYRMLKDFVELKSGDTVIVNGAGSSVCQAAVQLCKAWDIRFIGTVRASGQEFEKTKTFLKQLGASEVLTEEETAKSSLFKDKKYKKPKLALNCVGGKSASDIARHLDKKGVMVTYGGMSRQPVTMATPNFIFNDHRYVGYWMSRWSAEHINSPKQKKMFDELLRLIKEGKLKPAPYQFVPLEDFKLAEPALKLKSFGGKKAIFFMCHK